LIFSTRIHYPTDAGWSKNVACAWRWRRQLELMVIMLSSAGCRLAPAANVRTPPFVSIDMNGPNRTLVAFAANGGFEPTPGIRILSKNCGIEPVTNWIAEASNYFLSFSEPFECVSMFLNCAQ
jgi:hypothetical protein